MQFPIVIGGVVPVVNIEGIKPGQIRSPALIDQIERYWQQSIDMTSTASASATVKR